MKNYIVYTIGLVYALFSFNVSAMSMEELRQYASQYKSTAKFSIEEAPQALTLSQMIMVADLKTTAPNITDIGIVLERGNDERLRVLEYLVLFSLSLKNTYEVSAEQIRLIGILRDTHHDGLLKQLDLYNSLDKYFVFYNRYMMPLPVISSADKAKVESFLSKPMEIDSDDVVAQEVLSFIRKKTESFRK